MQVKVIGCSTSWTDKPVSSYCINNTMLVDCGEGTLKYYQKCNIDFKNINHILITHMHSDHFLGVASFISQVLVYETEDQKFRLNIYGPKGLLKALTNMKELYSCPTINKRVEDYINVVELESNQTFNVENFEVSTIELDHNGMTNLAYIFNEKNKKVGFSGDCTFDENTQKFVKNSDVAFIDCCSEKTTKSHMGAEHLIMLQNKYPQKRLIAIHCTDEFLAKAKKLNIETTESGKEYTF